MSRQILTVREHGYVAKENDICWAIGYNSDGSHAYTMSIQDGFPFYEYTCSTSRVSHRANELGAWAPPSHDNGFTVLRGVGYCPNYPEDMIVITRASGHVFRASMVEANGETLWALTHYDMPHVDDLLVSCGTPPEITMIDEMPEIEPPPPWRPPPFLTGKGPDWPVIGVIASAIVLTVFIWKQ